MNVDVTEVHAGRIEISVPQGIALDELDRWREVVSQLLMLAFSGKRLGLMTLQPQSYSLGFEIEDRSKMLVDGRMVLVNVLPDVSPGMLYQIAQSEEFGRGLLRAFGTVATGSADLSRIHLAKVLRGEDDPVIQPFLFCDDDGSVLYWLDDHPPIQQIRACTAAQ